MEETLYETVLEKLSIQRIRKITFGGGEPLLLKNINRIIDRAKQYGFKTALCTNGILLNDQFLHRMVGLLDGITLPIDGSNAQIHALHRGSQQHFEDVLEKARLIQKYSIEFDISTVVTAVNSSDLLNIQELIIKLGVKKWKIFQYYPLGKMRHLRKDFLLRKSIASTIEDIEKEHRNLQIDFRANKESAMRSYFNISPNGNILIVTGDKYQNIGSVIHDSDFVSSLECNGFNFPLHYRRHRLDF